MSKISYEELVVFARMISEQTPKRAVVNPTLKPGQFFLSSSMTEEDRKNFFGIVAGAHKGSLWRCFLHNFGALDLNPYLLGA